MVAARGRPCDSEATQPASKRQCSRRETTGTSSAYRSGEAAEETLMHFNLAGMASAEQPVNQLAWRCLSDFNVLMRRHAGQLRDTALSGYMSLTRAGKTAVFSRLLEVEGLAVDAGQPWPLHVHMVACILQRVFFQWPQASLCRYSIQRPEWLDSWCTAWGLGGTRDISLFAVNVYDDAFAPMHVHGGELQAGPEHLDRTLFVPVVQ